MVDTIAVCVHRTLKNRQKVDAENLAGSDCFAGCFGGCFGGCSEGCSDGYRRFPGWVQWIDVTAETGRTVETDGSLSTEQEESYRSPDRE